MTDSSGAKYEFAGQKYRTTEDLSVALAAHLGMDRLPHWGKHSGNITVYDGAKFVTRFTYVHEDGVDKVTEI